MLAEVRGLGPRSHGWLLPAPALYEPVELGWNTLRDLLQAEGNAGLIGSRDTLRLAFRVGLILDAEARLAMVQDRHPTSHTYNRSTGQQVSQQVEGRYMPLFRELRLVLSERVQASAAEKGDG